MTQASSKIVSFVELSFCFAEVCNIKAAENINTQFLRNRLIGDYKNLYTTDLLHLFSLIHSQDFLDYQLNNSKKISKEEMLAWLELNFEYYFFGKRMAQSKVYANAVFPLKSYEQTQLYDCIVEPFALELTHVHNIRTLALNASSPKPV